MRKIMFRGKRKDNGKWSYGYLIGNQTDKKYITIVESHCDEVDPETVGQYTGLKDKNGAKIFEGDILHVVHQTDYIGIPNTDLGIGVIEYDGSYFGGAKHKINIIGETGFRYISTSLANGIEVIGNIYDNPELLEVEE